MLYLNLNLFKLNYGTFLRKLNVNLAALIYKNYNYIK